MRFAFSPHQPTPAPRGLPIGRRWRWTYRHQRIATRLLFPVIITSLLVVVYEGFTLAGAVRAYVEGESLWSKGQKEAVQYLYRFAMTHAAADYERYARALTFPMADRQARLELQRPHPDIDLAAAWFVKGGTHPEDARDMGLLFVRYGWISYIRQAIQYWANGDREIDSVRSIAFQLRQLVAAGVDNPDAYQQLLQRLTVTDERLTMLEAGFSQILGDGSRWLMHWIFAIVIAVGALLMWIGTTIFNRLLRHARAAARLARRHEEEFRALVEHAPDVIMRLDQALRHLYVNPMSTQVTGIPAAEFIGKTHAELGFPADLVAFWNDALRHVFATGNDRELECEFAGPTGVRQFHARITPIRAADGSVESVLIVSRDMSELKASERALRESEERLRQAQKMEAIGRLAGGVAHDFNNLLTVIQASIDIALRDCPSDGRFSTNMLQDARRAAERAEALTRQLLTFSRQQVVRSCVVRLDTTVYEMQRMLARLIGEDIELVTELDPATPAIEADPAQIGQVLLNLVVNAREAMPHGGRLAIRTYRQASYGSGVHAERGAPDDHLPADPPDGWAVLEVCDSGVGMDSTVQSHIFEPFFTTRKDGQGTGLGLSVVYGIVSQNGGHIDVRSQLGEGTIFRIFFPGRAAPCLLPPAEPRCVPRYGNETVLVAEDEASVRALVRELLTRDGYTVIEVASGEEALQWIEEHADEAGLDLIVTDVVMPVMGGRELIRELGRRGFQIPVVYMSGYTNDPAPLEDMAGERAPFLSKPFPVDRLSEVVRTTLDAQTFNVTHEQL